MALAELPILWVILAAKQLQRFRFLICSPNNPERQSLKLHEGN